MKPTHAILASLLALLLLASIAGSQEKSGQKDKQKTEKKHMQSSGNPIVVMKTSMGTIKLELFLDKAPVTVKNFLSYVDEKYYDQTVFHRVIKGFMIQGGGFDAGTPIKQKKTKATIVNESINGLKNDRGTIAMARTGDPNSATSQFFINVVDNNSLNRGAADPNGYAVFGKVIEGLDVVDKIREVKTSSAQAVASYNGKDVPTNFQDVPSTKVIVESVRRAEAK